MADISGVPLSAIQFIKDLENQVKSEVNNEHREAMRKLRVEVYNLKKENARLEALLKENVSEEFYQRRILGKYVRGSGEDE